MAVPGTLVYLTLRDRDRGLARRIVGKARKRLHKAFCRRRALFIGADDDSESKS